MTGDTEKLQAEADQVEDERFDKTADEEVLEGEVQERDGPIPDDQALTGRAVQGVDMVCNLVTEFFNIEYPPEFKKAAVAHLVPVMKKEWFNRWFGIAGGGKYDAEISAGLFFGTAIVNTYMEIRKRPPPEPGQEQQTDNDV